MKILFCCEFYSPSVGGVQEVMKQIAERLVARGHEVTVATTKLANRDFTSLNGVKIVEFEVVGNLVRGMQGEIDRYCEFVCNFPCDAILIKAAQQWTFDALWPVLDRIKARKVFIPCGFLSFFQPEYGEYFKNLYKILIKFDSLIFYSSDYRDINYARDHNLTNCIVLSNGASEEEFDILPDPTFRSRYNIPEDSFLILTVGALSGAKGHLELAEAVSLLSTCSKHVTLLLNGNNPYLKPLTKQSNLIQKNKFFYLVPNFSLLIGKLQSKIKFAFRLVRFIFNNSLVPSKIMNDIKRWNIQRERSLQTPSSRIYSCVQRINAQSSKKYAMLLDLNRKELIQAYLAADLFVFASHVEYSPLVLFEAAASKTPFLSSNVGNAKEIISWLGGGFLMDDLENDEGFRVINPQSLAYEIAALMNQGPYLKSVGRKMHEAWKKKYTWEIITSQYEKILLGDN